MHDKHLAEINLSLSPRCVFLRDEDFDPAARLHIDLRRAHPHVVPHGRIRQLRRTVLLNQPNQNPSGRMPLFPRRGNVSGQHPVDRWFEGLQPPRNTPSVSIGQHIPDAAGIAVPFTVSDHLIGSLSLSRPRNEFEESPIAPGAETLREAAKELADILRSSHASG